MKTVSKWIWFGVLAGELLQLHSSEEGPHRDSRRKRAEPEAGEPRVYGDQQVEQDWRG